MNLLTKHYLYRVLLGITVTIISYLAFSEPSQTQAITINDKLNHFIAFLALAWLTDKAFPSQKLFLKITLLLSYGFIIEVVQSTLSYRDFSLWDFVADGVGVFLYFSAIKILYKRSQRRAT